VIPVSSPSLTDVERSLLMGAFDSTQLTYGPVCAEFERRLADHLGVKYALVTSSGTTALHLALLATDLRPGDEVLIPNLTFVATHNAVVYCGARPVLVDVSRDTWCMDLDDAEKKCTNRTRAIVPVHLYGYPCDMERVNHLAARRGLYVVEDAAEGLGGTYKDRHLGTIGDMGIYSFYGNKVLTTGEGGAVVTNDSALAREVHLLRGQGVDPSRRYYHTAIGFNYRLTDLQAAVGLGQLSRLPDLLARRHAVVATYRDALRNTGVEWVEHLSQAPWLFTLLLPSKVDRDHVAAQLLEKHDIDTRPVFVPLHQLPFSSGYADSQFPVSTDIANRGLSLPTYPDLSLDHTKYIANTLLSLL
jgi:perosamine synthetase